MPRTCHHCSIAGDPGASVRCIMFQVQLEGATRSFDKGAERIFREQIYLPLSEPFVGRFIICRAAFIGLFIRSQAFMAQFIFRQVQGFVARFCSAERRVSWPDSFSAECTAVFHGPIQFLGAGFCGRPHFLPSAGFRGPIHFLPSAGFRGPAPFSAECRFRVLIHSVYLPN